MSKQMQKKQSNVPAEATNMGDWGESKMSSEDMVLPRIQALQFMSEKVKNGDGKYGEFRDTLGNRLFGDMDTPFTVIPFFMEKKWIEFDMVPKKQGGFVREFSSIVPIQDNPTKPGYNDKLPLRDEDGSKERDRVMDFYVLISEDIEQGQSFPYIIRFMRTSLKAGQNLATQMYVMNAAANKVPPATAMKISARTKENDMGEFVVMGVSPDRPSTKEELEEALKWYRLVQSGATKIDESGYEAPEAGAKDAAKETEF